MRGPKHKPIAIAALAGIGLGVFGVVLLYGASFGYRQGWWGIRDVFDALVWPVYMGCVAIVLSLLGCWKARADGRRRGLALGAIGLALGVVIAAIPPTEEELTRNVPAIHDITTDTDDPPLFVAIRAARQAAGTRNPPGYDGERVAKLQRAAYPDIQPLILPLAPDQAFERALNAARAMGWKILAAEKSEGRIEATATTRWMHFKDDVVVRIRAEGGGASASRIDVRSKSRIGVSDLGTNARRVRQYLERVR